MEPVIVLSVLATGLLLMLVFSYFRGRRQVLCVECKWQGRFNEAHPPTEDERSYGCPDCGGVVD